MPRSKQSRCFAAVLTTLALAASACGGSDGEVLLSDDASADQALQPSENESSESGSVESQPLETPPAEIPNVDPVVDTCSIMSAEQLTEITNAIAANYGSSERDYTAELDGATCRYTWDNSIVDITIGSSSQVSNDLSTVPIPLGAILGEATTTPWENDGSVTIFADDWNGVIVQFGGHTQSGDYGIRIMNVGGTVVDPSLEGQLYGEVLVAAVANLG